MEKGAEAGLIEKAEHETVRRLFRLSDRAVMALEANPAPRLRAPRSEKHRFRMPSGESFRALAGFVKSVLTIPLQMRF
jgi:hypothetical protein